MTHVLDNPVWHALASRQNTISLGTGRARRYLPDISPWAAVIDADGGALDDLAGLVPSDGSVILVRNSDHPFASTASLSAAQFEGLQMVAQNVAALRTSEEVIDLAETDAPDMIELAALTRPGPFIARTHTLGEFVGIRKQGKLVAMAGERFRLGGYVEVSGVCTHPDWRGRGYAGLLSRIVATRIADRGEVPFLHAFMTNTAAIRLYEELGFAARAVMKGVVFRRA